MLFSFYIELAVQRRLTKKEIDSCDVSLAWAAVCDTIRAIFFLSRSIRKERDLWLFLSDLGMVLVLSGKSIKYLGPDERSMLMLVDKAMIALNIQGSRENDALQGNDWIESTPGVRCKMIASEDDVLQAFAKENDDSVFYFPKFTVPEDNAEIGISFPKELPTKVATSRVCVLLGSDDGVAVPSWFATEPKPSTPIGSIKLIKEAINTRTKLNTLASKIMLFNLIEDNFRADGT